MTRNPSTGPFSPTTLSTLTPPHSMFLNFDAGSSAPTHAPPTRAPVVLGVVTALYLVAIAFVSAQILVKSKLGKLGVEDFLISISSTLLLGLLINTSISCKYGFGMHLADIKPEWILPYGKITYASIILATLCYAVTKGAMLCFYLRFATSRRFRIFCWLTIGYIGCAATAALLVHMFGCSPVSGAWDRRPVNPSKCVMSTPFYVYNKASNMVTDAVLMVLPIPLVVRLRLGWVVKLGLVVMFSMGFLVTAVEVVAMWKMVVAVEGDDITWYGAIGWMWTLSELNVGIMTTCMPGMRMFIAWMRGDSKPVEQQEDTIGGGARRGRKKMRVCVLESELECGVNLGQTQELRECVSAV